MSKANLLKKYKEEPKKNIKRNQKEELIKEYAPLIKFVAQKIAVRLPPNIELDDLISAGSIGLMDAIDKWDPTRDNKFKTYAEFRIRGAILDELRGMHGGARGQLRFEARQSIVRDYPELQRAEGARSAASFGLPAGPERRNQSGGNPADSGTI